MVIRNLEQIPVKDFNLRSCKLKTCNCTKIDTFTSIFKVLTASVVQLQGKVFFCRTPIFAERLSMAAFKKLTTNVYNDWHIAGVQLEIFQGRRLSLEWGHFNKWQGDISPTHTSCTPALSSFSSFYMLG